MKRGFIKLYRSSFDTALYNCEAFGKFHAWIDLLLLANHQDRHINVRGIMVPVKRGQVLASEEFLADRWKWSRGKVRRFLQYLEQQTVQQIVQHKNNICTVISITNYSIYQGNGTADGTADGTTNGTADGQQTDIPNKLKKGKNEEEIGATNFIPPTVDEVKSYISERGYSWLDPEQFVNFYQSKGWMIGKNKMKDWKACIATWKKKHNSNQPQPMHALKGY